ncbi:MAG: AAA-like domain-containing protein [Bacteroidota bacterium]
MWAPRQTGKSTYFRQLAKELEKKDYKVAHINFENYRNASLNSFLLSLIRHLKESWGIDFSEIKEIARIFELIQNYKEEKCILIIDEVEGINNEYFGDFLHSIRNAYHSRENHCLKSVILVGVSNIVGVVSDNASPFNIADNLDVPYFTAEEVHELLRQHETETGQLFDENNKLKLNKLIAGYKEYAKRRGFNVFREKDNDGKYRSIKESALIYSFETYIQAFLQVVEGKSYREADTGLGKSDLTINVQSEEYLIESKVYYYENQFLKGKKQLAYYCKSLGLDKGVYLVFCPNNIEYPDSIKEKFEMIENVEISTFLISYDETKW